METNHDFRCYLLSSGKSPGTAFTYEANLSIFSRWCARYRLRACDADRDTIRAWINDRLRCVSSARVHNELAALKQYFAFVRESGYRGDDPTAGIKVKRSKSLPTKPLTEEEVDALVAACNCERDRLLILVLAYTGLRVAEMASLTAENIDWQRGEIRIRGKGDKERRLAPKAEVLNRLHAYLGFFHQGPVWLSRRGRPLSAQQIRKLLYEIGQRAKVANVYPHRFRAFFATLFIEQHADIQALQGLLGHESIETTARYSEWTRDQRALDLMRRLA